MEQVNNQVLNSCLNVPNTLRAVSTTSSDLQQKPACMCAKHNPVPARAMLGITYYPCTQSCNAIYIGKVALVYAGPLSSTQRELWAVLTQKQLPNTLAAANTAEAALNSQVSGLMRNLTAQSGGNGTQLTIANAVWTNRTSVLKPYSDSMLKLFQASSTC
jgi:hypothetical protein